MLYQIRYNGMGNHYTYFLVQILVFCFVILAILVFYEFW